MMGHEAQQQRHEGVDVEVVPKAQRRRFSAAYKQKILETVDQCADAQSRGQLLRREGLYSSHVSTWRRQRDDGALKGLTPKKRGRKPRAVDPQARRVAELERECSRLRHRLQQAEMIIDVQKKLSRLLSTSSPGDL